MVSSLDNGRAAPAAARKRSLSPSAATPNKRPRRAAPIEWLGPRDVRITGLVPGLDIVRLDTTVPESRQSHFFVQKDRANISYSNEAAILHKIMDRILDSEGPGGYVMVLKKVVRARIASRDNSIECGTCDILNLRSSHMLVGLCANAYHLSRSCFSTWTSQRRTHGSHSIQLTPGLISAKRRRKRTLSQRHVKPPSPRMEGARQPAMARLGAIELVVPQPALTQMRMNVQSTVRRLTQPASKPTRRL